MNAVPVLFLGVFLSLALSFWGLILAPQLKIGRQTQVKVASTGQWYPPPRGGAAEQGAEVYRSLGCVECHTQQVRARGADLARGWGKRRTVAQDYLGDYPVFVGQQRIGPDLANIGFRRASRRDLLLLLYNPRLITPGSMMPQYPFLFERRRITSTQPPSPKAIPLEGLPEDVQLVPRPEAEALVAYLLSLRVEVPLFEAPVPKTPETTNAAPASASGGSPTNAPAPSTNAPAPAPKS